MYKKVKTICCVVFSLLTFTCWSQNEPPVLTATGDQGYCPGTQINVVTDFNIVDPDDTGVEYISVQISEGYVPGEDVLSLTGTHPAINPEFTSLDGKLTLRSTVSGGDVSFTDLIAAIKDVVFESSNSNPTSKDFSITIEDISDDTTSEPLFGHTYYGVNYLPSTGHFYEYIGRNQITWDKAKEIAEARTYYGLQGYLVTVTSEEEKQLTGEHAIGTGWIGGTDVETEGVWKWVTGPEGLANGGTGTEFVYTDWTSGQPDNAHGGEDYAHVTHPDVDPDRGWNDLRQEGEGSPNFQAKGYIVEYGGMPGDPVINVSASTSITTGGGTSSIVDTKPAGTCENGSVTLEATASLGGTVLWFDVLTGGTQLGSGSTFTIPTLTSTTTYYASAVSGCSEEGTRVPVIATVISKPTIDSVTGNENPICVSQSVTLIATSLVDINWYDAPNGGVLLSTGGTFVTPALNTTTTYYVEATGNGCISDGRTPVTITVQSTLVPTTTNTDQSFCEEELASVSSLVVTGSGVQWYSSSSGGFPLNTSETLTDDTTYYASQTIDGCESVDRLAINVTFKEPSVCKANIEVTKTAQLSGTEKGDVITYTIEVENTGSMILTGLTLVDTFLDVDGNTMTLTEEPVFDSADQGSLEGTLLLGEIATYTASFTITESAISAGGVSNSVVATALDVLSNIISDISDDGDDIDGNVSDDPTVTELNCLLINEFSPNGDSIGQTFVINCIENYPNNKLEVYNRWGNKVYEKKSYNNDWDGTSNGRATVNGSEKLSVGTYYYVLDYGDGSKPKVGWLYINR